MARWRSISFPFDTWANWNTAIWCTDSVIDPSDLCLLVICAQCYASPWVWDGPETCFNQQNMAKVMGSYFWWDVIMLHKIMIAILLAASPPCWLWWSKLPCWGDPCVKTYNYFSTQKDILETLLPSFWLSKGSL